MPETYEYVSADEAFQALVDIFDAAREEKNEYGYLGIVNDDATAYEFFVENEPGYVHCRIERGTALEFAKCIVRVALIPDIRCRFERVNGVLEAKEFVGTDAVRVLGDQAPGAGVPTPPIPGYGAIYPPPVFDDPANKIIGADDKVSVGDAMQRHLVLAPPSGTTDDLIEIEGLAVGDLVVITPAVGCTITIKNDDAGATDKTLLYNNTDLELVYPQVLLLFKRAAGQVVQPVDEGGVQSIVEGANITVDDTDPANPIVSVTGISGIYPQYAEMTGENIIAGQGTWVWNSSPGSIYGVEYFQSGTPADGDNFSLSFMLEAGTYTLYVNSDKANNRGIVDWNLDGVDVLTGQDWYHATSVLNVIQSGSISVLTSGRHILTMTLNGKNASSSSYYYAMTKVWIKPAAYS